MVAEVNDIAFLTMRCRKTVAHLIEGAVGNGIFLSDDGRRFDPRYDVGFPFGIVRCAVGTGLGDDFFRRQVRYIDSAMDKT